MRGDEFRKIYELMEHGKWLFCKCVVGLEVKERIWKEGYVYQFIRDGKEEMHFIYTKLKFNPLIWTRKKLLKHLEKLFSFVPEEIIVSDHSHLERFNRGLQVDYLSYPEKREMREEEEGVFFITPEGEKVTLVKGKGKPIPKWETLTLFHPLCPFPAL